MDSLDIVFSKESGLYNDHKESKESFGIIALSIALGAMIILWISTSVKENIDKKKAEKIYSENKDKINEIFSKSYDDYKEVQKNFKQVFLKVYKSNWKEKHDLLKYCKFNEKLESPTSLMNDMMNNQPNYIKNRNIMNGKINVNKTLVGIDFMKYCEKEEEIDYGGDYNENKHDSLYKAVKSLKNAVNKEFNKYKNITLDIETNPDDDYVEINAVINVDFSFLLTKIKK